MNRQETDSGPREVSCKVMVIRIKRIYLGFFDNISLPLSFLALITSFTPHLTLPAGGDRR